MKNILTQEGLAKAPMPKPSKPEKMTDEAWEDLRDMANSTIHLYLASNTLREVIGLTDTSEVWGKLENMYESKSLTNRLFIKNQLYGPKLEGVAKLEVHQDEFNKDLNRFVSS